MATQTYKQWLKNHPDAITSCDLCGGHLGSELVRNGITHHVQNCRKGVGRDVKMNKEAMHTGHPYPTIFRFNGA